MRRETRVNYFHRPPITPTPIDMSKETRDRAQFNRSRRVWKYWWLCDKNEPIRRFDSAAGAFDAKHTRERALTVAGITISQLSVKRQEIGFGDVNRWLDV